MNYQNIYNSLISYRKSVVPSGYAERHHIVPKSIGGDNSTDNLVYLTAREHYFCHKLLARIYGGKMWQALFLMSNARVTSAKGLVVSSRDYSIAKRKAAKEKSESMKNQNVGRGIKNVSADHNIYRFSNADHGIVADTRSGLCKRFNLDPKGVSRIVIGSAKSYLGWCFHGDNSTSTVTRHIKQRWNTLGIKLSKDHVASLIEAKKNEPIVSCPYCGVSGKGGVMHRWHFERCKSK